jgi:hypothetical protein
LKRNRLATLIRAAASFAPFNLHFLKKKDFFSSLETRPCLLWLACLFLSFFVYFAFSAFHASADVT